MEYVLEALLRNVVSFFLSGQDTPVRKFREERVLFVFMLGKRLIYTVRVVINSKQNWDCVRMNKDKNKVYLSFLSPQA